MRELYPHQRKAVDALGNGKVLWGGVGSGKTFTAVTYYMEKEAPKDVYVITTPKKRDDLDWDGEFARMGVGKAPDATVAGVLTVDSWNKIKAYEGVEGAFFIFDEQRLVGSGAWVKAFLNIAKKNRWILLSATPGDTWIDYIPVFVANGFYKNRTQFKQEHVVYDQYSKYPKILRYLGEGKLQKHRSDILVKMSFDRHTVRRTYILEVDYDRERYLRVMKKRWNHELDRPVKTRSEAFALARRDINTHPSRVETALSILEKHPKLIIFYNFTSELVALKEGIERLKPGIRVAELNGSRHDDCPFCVDFGPNVINNRPWENGPEGGLVVQGAYLVNFMAGSEAWNCTSTDAMLMFSLPYSWRMWEQAHGRIDRLDTPYKELHYYVMKSSCELERGIWKALKRKENFNESAFGPFF